MAWPSIILYSSFSHALPCLLLLLLLFSRYVGHVTESCKQSSMSRDYELPFLFLQKFQFFRRTHAETLALETSHY